MCEKLEPDVIRKLFQTPLGPPVGEPLVAVWGTVSGFSQVTVPPTSIVTVLGRKHALVSSHPGIKESGTFCTVACMTDGSVASCRGSGGDSVTMLVSLVNSVVTTTSGGDSSCKNGASKLSQLFTICVYSSSHQIALDSGSKPSSTKYWLSFGLKPYVQHAKL